MLTFLEIGKYAQSLADDDADDDAGSRDSLAPRTELYHIGEAGAGVLRVVA
jgi:hypothetical protein